MKLKIALLFFILFSFGFAQKTLDKVVAVIDNEIILQSELEFQINIYATQRGISFNSRAERTNSKIND